MRSPMNSRLSCDSRVPSSLLMSLSRSIKELAIALARRGSLSYTRTRILPPSCSSNETFRESSLTAFSMDESLMPYTLKRSNARTTPSMALRLCRMAR